MASTLDDGRVPWRYANMPPRLRHRLAASGCGLADVMSAAPAGRTVSQLGILPQSAEQILKADASINFTAGGRRAR